jgi:hypothetical protein
MIDDGNGESIEEGNQISISGQKMDLQASGYRKSGLHFGVWQPILFWLEVLIYGVSVLRHQVQNFGDIIIDSWPSTENTRSQLEQIYFSAAMECFLRLGAVWKQYI